MRLQLNFGTSHPLPPFLEGGGKSAPPRAFKEPKKAGANRVKGSGGCSEEEVLVAVPATAVLTNGLFIEQVFFTMIFLEPGARCHYMMLPRFHSCDADQ